MNAQIITVADTLWINPPDEGVARNSAPSGPALKPVMNEFVAMLKENPKVWAVYAKEDRSVIIVWTYIDSIDRSDRQPIYEAEWRLLKMYPQLSFDFNTALMPAGSEQFDDDETAFLYRR